MTSSVTNVANGATLAHDVRCATTFGARLRGLMFAAELPRRQGVWISPCKSVHSCFMRFPIDVIFVDHENTVVGLVTNLRPWNFSHIFRSAKGALEVPAGTIAASNTKIGDALKFSKVQ